jgi:hypothetical protein
MSEKRIKDLMLDVLALERISPQTKVAEAVKLHLLAGSVFGGM